MGVQVYSTLHMYNARNIIITGLQFYQSVQGAEGYRCIYLEVLTDSAKCIFVNFEHKKTPGILSL